MKRRVLISHIEKYRCFLLREGARHSVYKNLVNGKMSTIPRHTEIDDFLVKKICRDLNVPWAR